MWETKLSTDHKDFTQIMAELTQISQCNDLNDFYASRQ